MGTLMHFHLLFCFHCLQLQWEGTKLQDVLERLPSTKPSLPTRLCLRSSKPARLCHHALYPAEVCKAGISRDAGRQTSSPGCHPHTVLTARCPEPSHSVLRTHSLSPMKSSLSPNFKHFLHFLVLIETWVFVQTLLPLFSLPLPLCHGP